MQAHLPGVCTLDMFNGRVGDLVAKGTVNASIHRVVYETLERSAIGYIVHSFYRPRALGYDICPTCENPEIR